MTPSSGALALTTLMAVQATTPSGVGRASMRSMAEQA